MVYQDVIDGFAKKIAGLSNSRTWNDMKFYDSEDNSWSPISGAATITETPGTSSFLKTLTLIGSPFSDTDPGPVRYPNTWQLLDGSTVGFSFVEDTGWIHDYSFVYTINVTIS